MNKTIYVIWNDTDDRPAICSAMYGCMIVYLTLEQAQAYQASFPEEKGFSIREFDIKMT